MENTTMNLKEEFKQYEELFKKHNLYLSDLQTLEQNYIITVETNRFEKLGRKHFPKKATETTKEVITARQYALYMSSIGFFGDRVEKTYTTWGYKPYKLTCINPNKEVKIQRIFRFELKK